jgi:hypothetical protein
MCPSLRALAAAIPRLADHITQVKQPFHHDYLE